MQNSLVGRANAATFLITVIGKDGYQDWRAHCPPAAAAWLDATGFTAAAGRTGLLPGDGGALAGALFIAPEKASDIWPWSGLAAALPGGRYRLDGKLTPAMAEAAALGWGLAAYRFTRYRTRPDDGPVRELVWPKGVDRPHILRTLAGVGMVRDLVTMPAEDMGPAELAAATAALAKAHRAKLRVIAGDDLLKANFPAIHTVGRASANAPRLIDLTWGRAKHPKLTLVGKGVCFDSGGLDIKSAANMQLMKKDMGGAAHMLALAGMIMDAGLPVRLRLLIGAVENAVSGNAYRPGDVIRMRSGKTVEVGNTDAEGRLVLADCLALAGEDAPDLIIDFATLTGAARVALGTQLPALFCNDDAVADDLIAHGVRLGDPFWRMPLHRPYRTLLDSPVADLSSIGKNGLGGAITAALFLETFLPENASWAHIDLMTYNTGSSPGRPEGGEAQGLRAAFAMLTARYGGD